MDVLACADDQLADPARNGEFAAGVDPGEVTGAVPPVAQHLNGVVGTAVVPGHDAWSGHPQLALVPRITAATACAAVADTCPGARQTPPTGAGGTAPARCRQGDGPRLGAPVVLEERDPADLLEGPLEGGTCGRTATDTATERGGRQPL